MSFSFDKITNGLPTLTKSLPSLGSVLDPKNSRLSITNMLSGGRRKTQKAPLTQIGFAVSPAQGEPIPLDKDWRVRISVSRESGIFYQGDAGIMGPLLETMGVVFPYTPAITINHSATYSSVKPMHSNYPAFFYENSEVQAISISGDFTVQTREEGQYLLAVIYFFRAATKMFYGTGKHLGNPPPLLFLDGYGSHVLPHVPCVLTSFQHVIDKDVDYIEVPNLVNTPTTSNFSGAPRANGATVPGKGAYNRLPTLSQIQVTLQPLYSRNRVAEFDLQAFARGDLINKGFL